MGSEILYIIMVDMLEPLPNSSCPERGPSISVYNTGEENTREHSPEDSMRKPPVQRIERIQQKNIVIGLEVQTFVYWWRWQEG